MDNKDEEGVSGFQKQKDHLPESSFLNTTTGEPSTPDMTGSRGRVSTVEPLSRSSNLIEG